MCLFTKFSVYSFLVVKSRSSPNTGTLSSFSPSSSMSSILGTLSFSAGPWLLFAFLFGVVLMPWISRVLKNAHAARYTEDSDPLSFPCWLMKREYALGVILTSFWNSPTFISPLSIKVRILRLQMNQILYLRDTFIAL